MKHFVRKKYGEKLVKSKIIIFFIIWGFICSSLLVCNAFSANRQAMQEKIKNFKLKYGKSAEIVLSDTTGLPYRISGIKTKAQEGEPDEIALSFLSENSSFLGINKNDVKVDVCQDLKEKGVKYVKFKQYYKGLPVEGSKIIIHMKNDKTIDRIVKSKYYPNLDIDIVPSIPIEKAAESVKMDLGIDKLFHVSLKEESIITTPGVKLEEMIKLKKELLPVKPELIIYPMNGDKYPISIMG